MGRFCCRDKKDAIELQRLSRVLRRDQVTNVGGIESTAEYAGSHEWVVVSLAAVVAAGFTTTMPCTNFAASLSG
jgi:hypothetical protein